MPPSARSSKRQTEERGKKHKDRSDQGGGLSVFNLDKKSWKTKIERNSNGSPEDDDGNFQ